MNIYVSVAFKVNVLTYGCFPNIASTTSTFCLFFFHDHNITDSTKKKQPLFHNKASYKLCLTANNYILLIS